MYITEVTHTRPSGGAFPAVWYVGLVGVVSIAQQRAGGRSPAASNSVGFTELDSTFFLCAVVCCGGLTPLWMSHPRRDVLTDYRKQKQMSGGDLKTLFVPLSKRLYKLKCFGLKRDDLHLEQLWHWVKVTEGMIISTLQYFYTKYCDLVHS